MLITSQFSFSHKSKWLVLAWTVLCVFLQGCHSTPETLTDSEIAYLEKVWLVYKLHGLKGPDVSAPFIDSIFWREEQKSPFKVEMYCQAKAWIYTQRDADAPKLRHYMDSLRSVDQLVFREYYSHEYLMFMIRKSKLYLRQQYFDRGLKSFFQAKLLAESANDIIALTTLNEELGNASYRQKQYADAANYYRLSRQYLLLQNKEKDHNFYALNQGLLNNIALCHSRNSSPDSAQFYYQKALDVLGEQAEEMPEDSVFLAHARSVVNGNMADMSLKRGQFEQAEKLYKKGIEDYMTQPLQAHVALITISKLGIAYVERNELEKAGELLSLGHKILDSLTNNYGDEFIVKFGWKYHDAMGNSEETVKYMKKWHQYKFSKGTDSPRELADIDFSNEFNKYQNSMDLTSLKETEKLKTQVLIGSSVLAAILLVFFIQIRLSNKKLAKLNQRITLQNNELKVSNQALKESQEENARIMKVLAHDLRNPIGGFVSLADALLEYPDHTEDNKEMIELIQQSGEDALGFVNDLLSINVTSVDIKREPVELDEVMAKTLMLLKHKAAEKNIVLRQNLTSVTAKVDREKISRVFGNLLSNAIKFSHIDSQIEVAIERKGANALISIKDHGLGIPEKIQKVLFDISHTKKRHGTAGEESFGLGLSICKQIVEAHDGRIWFETEENEGTTFFVEV